MWAIDFPFVARLTETERKALLHHLLWGKPHRKVCEAIVHVYVPDCQRRQAVVSAVHRARTLVKRNSNVDVMRARLVWVAANRLLNEIKRKSC